MAKMDCNLYGTGRIGEVIEGLKKLYKIESIAQLNTKQKLDILCDILQLSYKQFDRLIANNSPVYRTIKGHAFETIFDHLVINSGYNIKDVGGDKAVDRILNGKTLQLKTPTMAGTRNNIVQYKTHKTHGAKSERESLDYYHSKAEFADYLVGLVSYDPLRILILTRDELPTHPKDKKKILSPFGIRWDNHPGLNAFDRIGIEKLDLSAILKIDLSKELLPLSAKKFQVPTHIIIDTIFKETNFRIWDMNFRGFAREIAFRDYLTSLNVKLYPVSITKNKRFDKSDLALRYQKDKKYYLFQIKGPSINLCKLKGQDSIITIETQLTRGRVNDHPTQSRLYFQNDFDYLILSLDPCVSHLCMGNKAAELSWQFYAIPTKDLKTHREFQKRLKSMQTFTYMELQKYRVNSDWINMWEKG